MRDKFHSEADLIPNIGAIAPSPALKELSLSPSDRREQNQALRISAQKLVLGSAILSGIAGLAGFAVLFDLEIEPKAVSLYVVIALAGIGQVPLIVLYWSKSLRYWESSRRTMRFERYPIISLGKSTFSLVSCMLECIFNLVVLVPSQYLSFQVELFGQINHFSLFSLCYALILLRNYHFIRLFYWNCPFSSVRARVYARLTSTACNFTYILRGCLARYSYKMVLCLYCLSALLLALFGHLARRDPAALDSSDISNDVWTVTYTENTIGYGDQLSTSFVYRLVLMTSAFAGSVLFGLLSAMSAQSLRLNIAESSLCVELLYRANSAAEVQEAARLLQSWWRLMRMRAMKALHGPVIQFFYFRLGHFRKASVRRRRLKFGLFEYQIEALEVSTRAAIRRFSDYLLPLGPAVGLAEDIERAKYRFNMSLKLLTKRIRRLSSKVRGDPTPSTAGTPSSPRKGRNPAFSKLAAYQQVKARLLSSSPCPSY